MSEGQRGLRILVVAPHLPYPPDAGFTIRVFQLARHLALEHEITLLAYGRPEEALKVAALEACGIHVHTVVPPERVRPLGETHVASRIAELRIRVAQLAHMPLPTSYQGSYLMTRALADALHGLLHAGRFDVLQLEGSELWRLARVAREADRRVAIVLDEHNVEYELRRRIAGRQGWTYRALNNRLEAAKFRREERRLWHDVDACLVVSERDRSIVTAAVQGLRAALVPNGADVASFTPRVSPSPDALRLVFVGKMDYRPNVDGVRWFVERVLPRIRDDLPARLRIVGANPTPDVRSLAGEAVEVTGAVPDVRPHLASASVVVVPLHSGGGTRIKILEALAMARPVVSTAVGAEGLHVVDGEHLVIADDPESMAAAIVRLLRDPAGAEVLGRAGRALVEREYDWSAIASGVGSFYRDLVGERG